MDSKSINARAVACKTEDELAVLVREVCPGPDAERMIATPGALDKLLFQLHGWNGDPARCARYRGRYHGH